ncbi:MAG: hypothetical protein ACJ74H_08605 [Thermoanaerobaculia bacterium]
MSDCGDVRRAVEEHGLLLLQDKSALDIVGMLAGEKLSTSWWGHAAGQTIFACLDRLDDDPDVIATRLVGRKITYVHRRLWPAFLAMATSGEPWQMKGLTPQARKLLDAVQRDDVRASGPAARELQDRLLVHARQVHTESGRHETQLQSWQRFTKVKPKPKNAAATIEDAVAEIGGKATSLPWRRRL